MITNNASAAYFNATVEELQKAGESLDDVAQLSGGGYLASIGVYHELHCVVSSTLLVLNGAYRLRMIRSANSASTSTETDIIRI